MEGVILRIREWEEKRCGGRNGVGMGVAGPITNSANQSNWGLVAYVVSFLDFCGVLSFFWSVALHFHWSGSVQALGRHFRG